MAFINIAPDRVFLSSTFHPGIVFRPRLDRRSIRHAIDEEIKGIETSTESVFYTCGGKKHGKENIGTPEKPDVEFTSLDFMKCGKKPVAVIHTHNIASGMPSNVDIDSYKNHLDFPEVKLKCSIGVDGVFCADTKGIVRRQSLSRSQEKEVLDATGTVKVAGDSVFCDEISGGDGKYYCSIQQGLNAEKPIGVFDAVSMVGGISWGMDDKADLTMSSLPGKKASCFAGTRGKTKQLSCIVDSSEK